MAELAPVAGLPGAGAAGGLGAALAALGAKLVRGVELVLDAVRFEERLAGVSLAVTGEGRVDLSSAEGKTPAGVLSACGRAEVACVVFGGKVDPAGADALRRLGAREVRSLSGRPARAHDDLVQLGKALGRSL
jgi:glycerate kinase